ncbi:hypothetical protein CI109_101181 [Kwoniella shandongensis]|uniref:Mitochondrial import inner membrane translocase subunit TIM50 n=1 Tax=Kwoniella shandongensis TaxID=1734106 RepID=A0AAJ8MUP3_9TREE
MSYHTNDKYRPSRRGGDEQNRDRYRPPPPPRSEHDTTAAWYSDSRGHAGHYDSYGRGGFQEDRHGVNLRGQGNDRHWRRGQAGPSNYHQSAYVDQTYDPNYNRQAYSDTYNHPAPQPPYRPTPAWQDSQHEEKDRAPYLPPHIRFASNESSPRTTPTPAGIPSYTPPPLSGVPNTAPWSHQHPEATFAPPDGSRGFSSQSRVGSSPPPRARYQSPPPPAVSLPPPQYLDLSRPSNLIQRDTDIPKLLVLDLNGALVYRTRGTGDSRRPHPRPYLSCFLQYLFLPEREGLRPWEVFVWSSAQPHNVRAMVEGAFGQRWIGGIWEPETREGKEGLKRGEGRLTGVWARDKMGLNASDYSRKVQTTKDLNKVIDHVHDLSEHPSQLLPDLNEKTTVLLDDSPLKAVLQPWNQIVIPEYDKREHQDSKLAASLLRDENDDAAASGLDQILLAVIGILEELRTVNNVPAWVRGGGLTFDLKTKDNDASPEIETLPSHLSFTHWYEDPTVLRQWIDKGKAALKKKGIRVKHGMD